MTEQHLNKRNTRPMIFQQDVEAELGWPPGSTCAPVCFYSEAASLSYQVGSPHEFLSLLARTNSRNATGHWVRPKLSVALRNLFGIKVVSWNTANTEQDIDKMVSAGYLSTSAELGFYRSEVEGRLVTEIVDAGHAVIATVAPGFSTNRDLHAVVISRIHSNGYDQDIYSVHNPDKRTIDSIYSRSYIESDLQPGGACSVLLPSISAEAV